MAVITLVKLLESMYCKTECINDDHLAIALFLTWQTVAQYLSLSENDMEYAEQEGKERRVEALLKWRGKFGFEAACRELGEVLLSLSTADVAEKVCHPLKSRVMQLCHNTAYHDIAMALMLVCVCRHALN